VWTLPTRAAKLAERFGIEPEDDWVPRYNIVPPQMVVRQGSVEPKSSDSRLRIARSFVTTFLFPIGTDSGLQTATVRRISFSSLRAILVGIDLGFSAPRLKIFTRGRTLDDLCARATNPAVMG